jgi:hypothetical protein
LVNTIVDSKTCLNNVCYSLANTIIEDKELVRCADWLARHSIRHKLLTTYRLRWRGKGMEERDKDVAEEKESEQRRK